VKAFVSGGAGVIGRELVKRLHAKGHSVTVGDLQPCPRDWLQRYQDRFCYVQCDLNGYAGDDSVDVFFHLAATFDRLAESPTHWDENYRHNVALSHHLLSVVKAKRTVFASSYLIEPHPRNLTGAAKLYTECELEFLRKHKGQDSISARIYRSYGRGSRDVISRWIRAGLKGEAIQVHNEQTALDFIYAGDVAEALMRMGDSSAKGPIPVGFGTPMLIKDVVWLLSRQIPGLKVQRLPDQSSVESSSCDPRLMSSQLHWVPTTSVADGIAKIIEYEKKRCG